MENNGNRTGGGIGFSGALLILFIALKLCGVIHWSWLWVLSPLWIPLAMAVLVVILVYAIKTIWK